jgi:hypothetical protein
METRYGKIMILNFMEIETSGNGFAYARFSKT